MNPPMAARRMPAMNGRGMAERPPLGGWMAMPTMALTIGAPAKMIDMTATATMPGFMPDLVPEAMARRTKNAPMAPRMPANREIHIPLGGMFQVMFFDIIRMTSGARTAVRK
jgi:hypothetical protein